MRAWQAKRIPRSRQDTGKDWQAQGDSYILPGVDLRKQKGRCKRMNEQQTDSWLEYIAEKALPVFLQGVPREKQKGFSQRYREKLAMKYLGKLSLCASEEEKQELANRCVQEEKQEWEAALFEKKERYLMPDPHLEYLLETADQVLQMARKCVQGNTVLRDGKYGAWREKLESHARQVKDSHKVRASRVLTDALVELDRAYGRMNPGDMWGM